MTVRSLRPAEGWLTLALVAVMAAVVALAIDDPAWVLGQDEWTDFLPLASLLGVVAGFAGAKIGWPRWLVHLVGATFAGLLLPVLAGWALDPGSGFGEAFLATSNGTTDAYLDLAWRGRRLTDETAHFVLLLGVVAWANGQFAAYAVFGHRRPLDAVVALGIVLIVNMSITRNNELGYLVVFSAAALFLLIDMHVFDERLVWTRRRIGDPSQLSGLYLKGGSVLVAATIAGSLLLTGTASSAPLQGAFVGMEQRLIAFGEEITRILPVGGAQRALNVSFEDGQRIAGQWIEDPRPAFVATFDPAEASRPYYRATIHDTLQGMIWFQGGEARVTSTVRVPPATDLLAGTAEVPTIELLRPLTFRVEQLAWSSSDVLSPATPQLLSTEADVELVGGGIFLAGIRRDGTDPYELTAQVYAEGDEGLNQGVLRQAGTVYPPEIDERYLQVPEGMFADGTAAKALYDEIMTPLAGATPYDIAFQVERFFRDGDFVYATDVRQFDCDPLGVVECFARSRTGFCEYFASTMAMILREAGIPTRYARGFLPGDRVTGQAEDTVFLKNAHAWVEVYFPGIGWVLFDPTKSVAVSEQPPVGPPIPSPSAGASASPGGSLPTVTRPPEDFEPDDGGTGGFGTTGGPTNAAPFVAVAILLLLTVAAVAGAAWVRGPRGELSPQAAWSGITRLADRFGFGPRPTQTVYEYAGSLGELVPAVRPELQTVANAQVEVAYGRETLSGDRLRAIREANRRLRVGLLRLLFRRGRRSRGVRRIR